jgi:hypothetical protein
MYCARVRGGHAVGRLAVGFKGIGRATAIEAAKGESQMEGATHRVSIVILGLLEACVLVSRAWHFAQTKKIANKFYCR